ncbi:NADP-dependent oxidoreductase [Nocardioides sp. Bht2]|uniref:NADP-dependent oxidoreductase n=1 Tax=Nocardioides sp. Bht2 TaxID=3392297 RepID=UPI0039B5C735
MVRSREIQLVARPDGAATLDLFRIVEVDLRDPGPGEVLVRNEALSVDPYMRPKMDDVVSYTPPYALNVAMEGRAIGTVVASGADAVRVGTLVAHRAGWREYGLLRADEVEVLPDLGLPPTLHLGVLGITGFTAWVGLSGLAGRSSSERVFVSAAAGAVGSVAGQLARLRGARQVVGSAGSPEKVAWLRDELGFDAALDYRAAPIGATLPGVMPEGCDLYFDNVGGEQLSAALEVMNDYGSIVACGSIASYQTPGTSSAPANLHQVTRRRLTMRGFIASDHLHLREEFLTEVVGWVRSGELIGKESVSDGLASMPRAFLGMLRGANIGKTVVRLSG